MTIETAIRPDSPLRDRNRLAHCRGFRVNSPRGRLGFVEDVIEPLLDVDGTLVVRAGRIRSRHLLVPFDDVQAFDAHEWQILVRDDRRAPDAGLLAEWRRRRAAARREAPEDALRR